MTAKGMLVLYKLIIVLGIFGFVVLLRTMLRN